MRYYPKGRVVPPEEQLAVLRGYLAEHSIASRQDFVKLLHVTPHQATNILKHMVERGELIRVGEALSAAAGGAACRKIKLRLMIVSLWPLSIFIKMRFSCTSVTVGQTHLQRENALLKYALQSRFPPFSFPV